MTFESHIDAILNRHRELAALMAAADVPATDFTCYAREYAELGPVVDTLNAYRKAQSEMADLEVLLTDSDMKDMAEAELYALKDQLPALERAVSIALLPKDADDARNAILEIRAGTGGDEAALFAADLLRMYKGYALLRGWRFEVYELSESDLGGLRDAVVGIEGEHVFSSLKFESGVHRVQRVPDTEASGRIHTSAATVAVLPEAEDVDLDVNESELRIEVFRAGGAGGQHVNKTESAVRITHIPTGTVVVMQDEKSQHKNKAKAMKILKSRILDGQRQKLHDARAADRKSQVGSGDRSERIRTYNFPQGRVTDHRINLTLYAIDRVMTGDDLGKIIDALVTEDQAQRLAAIGA